MVKRILLGLFSIFIIHSPVYAQSNTAAQLKLPYPKMQVTPLVNGPNKVALEGNGEKDLLIVGRYENWNAHSSSRFAFYIYYSDEFLPGLAWYVVPFFDNKDNEVYISTLEGADCILRDIRVLYPGSKGKQPAVVIIGQRELGKSFADPAPVKFVVYELMRGDTPGFPPFYFKEKQVIRIKKKYCDINEAFAKELGIADYRKR